MVYETKITKQEQERLRELLAKQKAQDAQDREFFAYCLKRRSEVEAYFKKHDEQSAKRKARQQEQEQDFLDLGDEDDDIDYQKVSS